MAGRVQRPNPWRGRQCGRAIAGGGAPAGLAGPRIAPGLAGWLWLVRGRVLLEDAGTLALGARRPQGSPPAGVATQSASAIAQSSDDHPTTTWLKPSIFDPLEAGHQVHAAQQVTE
jgi:hypothetical protein